MEYIYISDVGAFYTSNISDIFWTMNSISDVGFLYLKRWGILIYQMSSLVHFISDTGFLYITISQMQDISTFDSERYLYILEMTDTYFSLHLRRRNRNMCRSQDDALYIYISQHHGYKLNKEIFSV